MHDNQPSSHAPNNDEKHMEDLLQHTINMAAYDPQQVGNQTWTMEFAHYKN